MKAILVKVYNDGRVCMVNLNTVHVFYNKTMDCDILNTILLVFSRGKNVHNINV